MKYYTDCFVIGSKNPSDIGGGYTIFDETNKLVLREEIRKKGFTNNEGELRGIHKAMELASFGDYVVTDSMVCFHWVRSGNPKARPDLKSIAEECHDFKINKNITLMWEPRESNLAGIHNEYVQKKNHWENKKSKFRVNNRMKKFYGKFPKSYTGKYREIE